jgi:hypothetical protein
MVRTTRDSRSRFAVERSATSEVLLRGDNVLLVRSSRGTWLMDIQVGVGGVQRRLQVPIGRHKALNRLATEIAGGDLAPLSEPRESGPMG